MRTPPSARPIRRQTALRTSTLASRGAGLRGRLVVDRDGGIIGNVPVCTMGLVHPSNAPSFTIDARTLADVAAAINVADPPLRVRVTHPELRGADGLLDTVGQIRAARIVADQVRADVVLGEYAAVSRHGNLREWLCTLAEEHPGNAGLSIVIDEGYLESEASDAPARIQTLYAVDIVGRPAGNPSGMLASRQEGPMNDNQREYLLALGLDPEADESAVVEFVAGLRARERSEYEALSGGGVSGGGGGRGGDGAEGDASPSASPSTGSAPGTAPGTASGSAQGTATSIGAGAASRPEPSGATDILELAQLAGKGVGWALERIRNNQRPVDVRRELIAERRANGRPLAMGVTVGENLALSSLAQGISDAILLKARVPLADLDECRAAVMEGRAPRVRAPHPRATEFRGLRMIEIGRRYFATIGQDVTGLSASAVAGLMIGRGRTLTGASLIGQVPANVRKIADLPNILGDSVARALQMAYAQAPRLWRMFCSSRSVPDYRDINAVQLGGFDLAVVPEATDYTYAAIGDRGEKYKLAKYGKGVAISREALINDDLSAFGRLPTQMGYFAAMLEDKLAFSILNTNPVMADTFAVFSAGHENLATAEGLTIQALNDMIAMVRAQTAQGSTSPMDLYPSVLVVPAVLDAAARQLVGSINVSATGTPSTATGTLVANPYAGQFTVVSSAWLTDPIAWYAMVAPGTLCESIEVAFLDGEEAPSVEQSEDFDSDVIRWKVRHSVAAAAIEWRGMAKNPGLAPSGLGSDLAAPSKGVSKHS